MDQQSKLRLFMDARYTRTDFHDGISRYSASLIQATAPLADVTMIISDERQLNLLPPRVPWVKISSPTSALEPLVARQLNRYRPDIVFSPMQTMGSVGRNYGLILTLHDLIYYQHRTPPRNLPAAVRGLWRLYHLAYWPQRALLNRADAVATVSETTQRLMRLHQLTSRPITVISNAPQIVDAPRDPSQAPEKFLVYMGSFMDYKNVETLVAAMRTLPEYRLHLLSPVDETRRAELDQLAHHHDLNPGQLIFHNGTDETEYRRLLRDATALVTMSRAEGFGLPLAESMAEGTPVIVSDMEIFREIGGSQGAGQYIPLGFDAESAPNVAAAVRQLESPVTFRAASAAAAAQAEQFTWDESARRLVDLAQSVDERRARRQG